ncbi:MAG TPA: MerR family transcriptional regulator [Ktedonobacteraceae bacterium]|jgi:DNA-binding transcriptional MerR regulator
MIDTKKQQGGTETTQNQEWYTIEQVANRTGLTKRTLRYYEEVGLLPPTDRTEGNYRRYSQTDVQLLERIKELRDLLDFSLSEIRMFLTVEEERGQLKQAYQQATEIQAKLAQLDQIDELIHKQLELVERKITGLEQMKTSLSNKLERHKQLRSELLGQQQ